MVNITWGEDIQPVIDGQYVLINRSTQRAVEITQGNTAEGTNVKTGKFDASKAYQRWYVRPVSDRIGGDFSYFYITSYSSGMFLYYVSHKWDVIRHLELVVGGRWEYRHLWCQ